MNSALSTNAQQRKTGNIVRLYKEFEIQGRSLLEVGVNWSTFPPLANLVLWFQDEIPDVRMHLANNTHKGVAHQTWWYRHFCMWRTGPIPQTERGGFLLPQQVVLVPYLCQPQASNKGCLGIQCGLPDPKRREHNIPTTTSIYSKSQTAHHSSKAIHSGLRGSFSSAAAARGQAPDFHGHERARSPGSSGKPVFRLGLSEATHHHWGNEEPHMYIGGVEPIDGVWHTLDLEVSAVLQLSFHEGVGDRCTVLVDITAYSAIGWQEFKVFHPHT